MNSTPKERLGGVDAARAVAVVGMVMVHFGLTSAPDTVPEALYEFPHGRASILFVLLAGVGVSLLASGRAVGWRARWRLVLRAALLLPLGLWLQGLDHGVYVILQFYALYFVLAALVLTLPDRWLLATGGAVLLGGPTLYLLGRRAAPGYFDGYAPALGDPASDVAHNLLLSGAYPLAVWSAPLLLGMWIGRRDLRPPAAGWWLLGAGILVAALAPLAAEALAPALRDTGLAALAADRPHAQTLPWMAGAIGSACAALGAALLVVGRLPRASWPLVATGQLALSVYVGHLLLLHFYPGLLGGEIRRAVVSVLVFVLLAVVACTLWRAVLPRGPLEAALAAPWWTVEKIFPVRGGTGRDRTTKRDLPPAMATQTSHDGERKKH